MQYSIRERYVYSFWEAIGGSAHQNQNKIIERTRNKIKGVDFDLRKFIHRETRRSPIQLTLNNESLMILLLNFCKSDNTFLSIDTPVGECAARFDLSLHV